MSKQDKTFYWTCDMDMNRKKYFLSTSTTTITKYAIKWWDKRDAHLLYACICICTCSYACVYDVYVGNRNMYFISLILILIRFLVSNLLVTQLLPGHGTYQRVTVEGGLRPSEWWSEQVLLLSKLGLFMPWPWLDTFPTFWYFPFEDYFCWNLLIKWMLRRAKIKFNKSVEELMSVDIKFNFSDGPINRLIRNGTI